MDLEHQANKEIICHNNNGGQDERVMTTSSSPEDDNNDNNNNRRHHRPTKEVSFRGIDTPTTKSSQQQQQQQIHREDTDATTASTSSASSSSKNDSNSINKNYNNNNETEEQEENNNDNEEMEESYIFDVESPQKEEEQQQRTTDADDVDSKQYRRQYQQQLSDGSSSTTNTNKSSRKSFRKKLQKLSTLSNMASIDEWEVPKVQTAIRKIFFPTERERFERNARRRSSRQNKNPLLSDTYSVREYKFVIGAGILLAFNAGYINGSCLSGLLTDTNAKQSVAGFTGYYTHSALYLADTTNTTQFGYNMKMILSFMFGSFITGAINHAVPPHRIAPTYCPTFLIGGLFLTIASILAAINEHGEHFFFFAAAANGIQNGISSLYSANLIRTTHFTGTTTDIGLFMGQVVRGNYKNLWKLQILLGLTISFWFGGFVSFYATSHFTSRSLLFNAGLFLLIGFALMYFLSTNLDITFVQVLFGNWSWRMALSKLNLTSLDGEPVSEDVLLSVFDEIDTDHNGYICQDELYDALKDKGLKGFTKKSVERMISIADTDNDGVISKPEWKALVWGGSTGFYNDNDK